jgi:hypothetical protein
LLRRRTARRLPEPGSGKRHRGIEDDPVLDADVVSGGSVDQIVIVLLGPDAVTEKNLRMCDLYETRVQVVRQETLFEVDRGAVIEFGADFPEWVRLKSTWTEGHLVDVVPFAFAETAVQLESFEHRRGVQ